MSFATKSCITLFTFFLLAAGVRAQWTAVSSGTSNQLRGVDLLDSGVAYAVGDAGTILKSTDAGATWSALSSGTTKALYDLEFLDDLTGVVVGDSGLILRTTDGGGSWLVVPGGVKDGLRSVSFNGANGISGGLSQDIIYSSDSGASWRVAQKGFFGGGFFGAHMVSPTVGFVTGQNSIFQGLAGMTVDGGAHWSFHSFYFNNTEGNADDNFFFDNLSGVTTGVLFDGTGAIARTSNGGADWSSTIFPQGMQGLDFPKPESGFAVGFGGTILHSSDLGATWVAQESGTFFDLLDVKFQGDAQTGLAVGAAGTILRTTNGGAAGGGLELVGAVSRRGTFDVDLLPDDGIGIECRGGGSGNHFKLILTFNNELIAVDNVSTSCGAVASSAIGPDDPHHFRISLSDVTCNAQIVTVTLSGVRDAEGNTLPSVELPFGLLLGDINGDGVVDSGDSHQVKLDRGAATDSTNFREDLNTSGRIDSVDFAIVKSQLGTMLPP